MLRILATAGQVDYASHPGMDDESYARFLPMLNSPNGIIYITGPTGSGKSTTLYMVLEYLSHRQVNISTVEDPVEKNVPSINQTQVNPVAGLTFESGLRCCVRIRISSWSVRPVTAKPPVFRFVRPSPVIWC